MQQRSGTSPSGPSFPSPGAPNQTWALALWTFRRKVADSDARTAMNRRSPTDGNYFSFFLSLAPPAAVCVAYISADKRGRLGDRGTLGNRSSRSGDLEGPFASRCVHLAIFPFESGSPPGFRRCDRRGFGIGEALRVKLPRSLYLDVDTVDELIEIFFRHINCAG